MSPGLSPLHTHGEYRCFPGLPFTAVHDQVIVLLLPTPQATAVDVTREELVYSSYSESEEEEEGGLRSAVVAQVSWALVNYHVITQSVVLTEGSSHTADDSLALNEVSMIDGPGTLVALSLPPSLVLGRCLQLLSVSAMTRLQTSHSGWRKG